MSKKAMLLVMDLVNDIVHPDGPNGAQPLGQEAARRKVIPNTRRALAAARAAGVGVGYVRVGFSAGYSECSSVSPMFGALRQYGILRLGEWGTEVHADIAPLPGDVDIVKHRISPFYASKLEAVLRGNDIRRLYLCGVSTNFVVNSGVREGHDRDYEIVVIEDCCSAESQAEHAAALAGFRPLCHAIATSDQPGF